MPKNATIRAAWLPKQHGAWPMTICPPLLGSWLSGWSWWQLVLALAWLSAFLSFNAFGLWAKSARNRHATLKPLLLYGLIALIGAVALLIHRPSLLWWALPLSPLMAVAIWETLKRRERSLAARLSAVLASSLTAPIAFSLGTTQNDWPHLWVVTGFLATYLIGTVPYVKTLIRERGQRQWLIGSLAFHAAVLVAAIVAASLGLVTWWVPASWGILLLRAAVFPFISERRSPANRAPARGTPATSNRASSNRSHSGRPLRPAVIGSTEIVFCAITMIALLA